MKNGEGMMEQTIQQQKAKELFNEIDKDYKPNRKRPKLGEFTTLKLYNKDAKVEFSIGWYDEFVIVFRPQTIGVKYYKTNPFTKEKSCVSKSYQLDQENLLDTVLSLYKM